MKHKTTKTNRSKLAGHKGPADNDTNTSRCIVNCRELRRAIAEGRHEFRLLLLGGVCFSRKHITIDDRGRFRVAHYIDDGIETLTGRELYTQAGIGEAMRNRSFIVEGQDCE